MTSYHEDKEFFDEGPTIVVRASAAHNTSSIATIDIDGWRQGVELTQQRHFDAGLVKIHAGEPGHILKKNRYGMDKNFRNSPIFEELDYFQPVKFMLAQDVLSPIDFNVITFPIITSDNDQIENFIFDGIIEPLIIRAKASFFSIDVPFDAHEPRGALMAGNTDSTWGTDVVQTVYHHDGKQITGFLDQYADAVMFEGQAAPGYMVPVSGFFHIEKRPCVPFNDTRYPRNAPIPTNYDSDLFDVVANMSGSTEGYINTIINERSATSGWDYDGNVTIGTDSIAFGGMTH